MLLNHCNNLNQKHVHLMGRVYDIFQSHIKNHILPMVDIRKNVSARCTTNR